MTLLRRMEKLVFKKFLNKKIINFYLGKVINDVNTNNPYEITKFEKQLRKNMLYGQR